MILDPISVVVIVFCLAGTVKIIVETWSIFQKTKQDSELRAEVRALRDKIEAMARN